MNNMQIVFTTLAAQPNYYSDVVHLIEEAFHYENNNKFEIDFALLLNPLNFQNCFIAIDAITKKLVGHLAFCKRTMIKNEIEIPVVFIGGIATHKAYQGKNIFRQLMSKCITENTQAALFFLWSDIENLYEKFAFYRAGATLETGKNIFLENNLPPNFTRTTFTQLNNKDYKRIQELYESEIEKNYFTVKRSNKDWDQIKSITSIEVFIRRQSNSDIDAYFAYGKGKDIPHIIHEACFANQDEMLSTLAQFKLWLPENFHQDFPNHSLQYTAFIKIGNVAHLNEFLKKISHDKLEVISLINGQVEFRYNGETHHTPEKDFAQYLFGPQPLTEFKSFNLSPYIAGTDSI